MEGTASHRLTSGSGGSLRAADAGGSVCSPFAGCACAAPAMPALCVDQPCCAPPHPPALRCSAPSHLQACPSGRAGDGAAGSRQQPAAQRAGGAGGPQVTLCAVVVVVVCMWVGVGARAGMGQARLCQKAICFEPGQPRYLRVPAERQSARAPAHCSTARPNSMSLLPSQTTTCGASAPTFPALQTSRNYRPLRAT